MELQEHRDVSRLVKATLRVFSIGGTTLFRICDDDALLVQYLGSHSLDHSVDCFARVRAFAAAMPERLHPLNVANLEMSPLFDCNKLNIFNSVLSVAPSFLRMCLVDCRFFRLMPRLNEAIWQLSAVVNMSHLRPTLDVVLAQDIKLLEFMDVQTLYETRLISFNQQNHPAAMKLCLHAYRCR